MEAEDAGVELHRSFKTRDRESNVVNGMIEGFQLVVRGIRDEI